MKIVSTGRSIHSPEFHEKKRRRRRALLILASLATLCLLSLLIYILRLENLLVREVSVSGTDATLELRESLEAKLQGHHFLLLPKRNFLLINESRLEEELLQEFLWLKSVKVRNGFDQELHLEVEERLPTALYCQSLLTGECFLVDASGFIFARVPETAGAVYFTYTLTEPLNSPLGETLVAEEVFRILPIFIDSLSVIGVKPLALELGARRHRLLLVSGGEIIFSSLSPFEKTRDDLETFLFSQEIRSQNDFLSRVEYIDLSVEDKVHYKLKSQ